MAEHTATPWRKACFQVYGADSSRIAHTGMGQLPPSRAPESEANAAFIVKACNSYYALIEALQLTAGALRSMEHASLIDPSGPIKFTGEWAHFGTLTIPAILDRANAALEPKAEG